MWQIERGSLTLERVDLYIDLTNRKVDDPEVVLLQLHEANLRLLDTTVTVVRGTVQGRSPVTFAKVEGERAWDPKAKGKPPAPLQVEFHRSFLRGVHMPLYVNSLQADIRFENCLICSPGPGPVVQLFHNRKREREHQRIRLDVGQCTLDTLGPLLSIECRPFDSAPLVEIKMHSTLVLSAQRRRDSRPPLVRWEKPIDSRALSTALTWQGQHNGYFQRGDCLQVREKAGPWATFVDGPDDWLRQRLGEENDPVDARIKKLPTGPWHARPTSMYPPYRHTDRDAPRGAILKLLPVLSGKPLPVGPVRGLGPHAARINAAGASSG